MPFPTTQDARAAASVPAVNYERVEDSLTDHQAYIALVDQLADMIDAIDAGSAAHLSVDGYAGGTMLVAGADARAMLVTALDAAVASAVALGTTLSGVVSELPP